MAGFHSKVWQSFFRSFVHFTQTTNERAKQMSCCCCMWRSQTKHLTSYQWMRENNWVSGKLSWFSQEPQRFSVFIVKAYFQQEPLTHGKGPLLKTKHFFYQLSFCFTHLFRWWFSFLFWVVVSIRFVLFPFLRFISLIVWILNTVLSCFTGIGLERKDVTG